MKYLTALFLLCALAGSAIAGEISAPKLDLKDGDRVAFIGDTFVEREQKDCYIETMLTSRFPDRNITFRNLGYSADAVTGSARGLCTGWATFESQDKAFDRLRKLVAEYKPTVLLMNYGMTESFSGLEGIPTFSANYNKMLDALSTAAGTSPRVVLMTPNYHEDLGKPLPDPAEHNRNLKLYSEAVLKIAAERKATAIDLFELTRKASAQEKLTFNGIHLTPFGYWWVAGAIERDLFSTPPGFSVTIADGKGTAFNIDALSDVKFTPEKVSFVARRQSLPASPPPNGHPAPAPAEKGRPGVVVLGLSDRAEIAGLKPGHYALKAGEAVVGSGTAEEWAAGVELKNTPDLAQTEALRKLIVAKNFDYFNYQRPDNDAYILAFRRGEQGRNAVEIPRFLPLVEEKEKQIAELRVPKPVKYVLEAVK